MAQGPPASPGRFPLAGRRGDLLLLAAGVALALLLGEAAVRLAGADRPRASNYAPVNTALRVNRHENARGYRDFERTLAKPAGVRRVVALGDSFTWGVGVKFEDAYPHRLERDLAARRGQRWEVVNLSLRGMNSVDEAQKLAAEGLAYDPDVVLLGYCLNDAEHAGSALARRTQDWADRLREGPRTGLLERSALARLVRGRLEATLDNRRRVQDYRDLYAADAPGWLAGRNALMRIGALCRNRDIPFVVAVFPLFGNALDDGYPFAAIHAVVANAATAAGAQVVDLLPSYRGLRWENLVVDGANDEHPNEIAHRIAANALTRAFDRILPRADEQAPAADAPR